MLRSSCSPGALPKRARRCWCWPPCSLSNMRSSETPRGLRIVGGVHRGRRLVAPFGEAVRPTSDRARDAMAIVEIAAREELPTPVGFTVIDDRVYGAARLMFLRYNGATTGGER